MSKDAYSADLDNGRMDGQSWVSLDTAAEQLGISVKTLRRWIQQGRIPSQKVEIPTGFTYRVQVPSHRVQPWTAYMDRGDGHHVHPTPQGVQPFDQVLLETFRSLVGQLQEEKTRLYCENADQAQHISRLSDERAELYGRLGFYQAEIQYLKAELDGVLAQLQLAQTRILELEAPKEAPAETANHSPAEQHGQDWSTQAVSAIPEEQPEAGRRSEVSAPPAANGASGQEGSSSGAFKRFWRWLTQPV